MLHFEGVYLSSGYPSLSLHVEPHTVVAVAGGDDSGVLRLARMALGMEDGGPAPGPPDRAGRVRVMGQEPASMPRRALLAFRRQVGYLPEGDGLLFNLSLTDNVALPLRFGSDMREADIAGRVRIILAAVGVAAHGSERPARCSEDVRRRAALGRALAFDPALVLLEQAFDGLTHRSALELMELARGGDSAGGSRRTVLMVGHSIPEAVRSRIDARYRLVRGELRKEA